MDQDSKYTVLCLVARSHFRARWLQHLVAYAYTKIILSAWKREAEVTPPGLDSSSDSDP